MNRILVTCVGSGVGQSVIDSLNSSTNHEIIGCDTNEMIYGRKQCDVFLKSPSIYSSDYVGFLLQICKVYKIELIIPGHDYELSLLSNEIQQFLDEGVDVVVSDNAIVNISRDKYKWYEYFSSLGCAIVPTCYVSNFLASPDETFFPAIVKPAAGSASQGITIVHKIEDLVHSNKDDIIQPYLFPVEDDPNHPAILNAVNNNDFVQMSEVSIQLIFTKNSKFENIFISENGLKNGVPTFVRPIPKNDFLFLEDIYKFIPILQANKARGPVNIQGRITESGFFCFEMNMRFTGITGTRAKLGFNEVNFVANDFLNKKISLISLPVNKVGVRQVSCEAISSGLKKQPLKKVITILGAGGYIGSHFLNQLIEKASPNLEIYLVCRAESIDKYERLNRSLNVTVVADDNSLLESIYNVTDVLINFIGALANVSDEEIFKATVYQQKQINFIRKANINLIINISSQSVYDQKLNLIKDEFSSVKIDNSYAFQKYFCESLFSSIKCDSPITKVISLRVSRVIGPHNSVDTKSGFFYFVISSLLAGKQVNLPNPFNSTNLIDIRDLSDFIIFLSQAEKKWDFPDVINVGAHNITVSEFCKAALNKLDLNHNAHLVKEVDTKIITASSMINTELMNSLGWSGPRELQETILAMKDKLSDDIS